MLSRTHLLSVLASSALAAVGCSSKHDAAPLDASAVIPAPAFTSGSRLRTKTVVTGDGQRQVIGIFDTARNEACTFMRAGDGRIRCLPDGVIGGTSAIGSDPTCSQRGLALPASCTRVAYAAQDDYDTGGECDAQEPRRSLSVLTKLDPSKVYGSQNGLACTLLTPAAGTDYYQLGGAIDPSAFVAADEQTQDIGHGLSARVYASEDGARVPFGFTLNAFGTCAFQWMDDGVARCVPSDAQRVSILYLDSACTAEPVVAAPSFGSACSTRSVYLDVPFTDSSGAGGSPSCGLPTAVLTIGEAVPDGRVYVASGARCELASSDSHALSRLTDVTASLPAASTPSGATRLVPRLVSTSGSAAAVPGWHDMARNVDCTFRVAADGRTRCLPVAPAMQAFYTDSACTSPDRIGAFSSMFCGAAAQYALVTENVCPPITRVYAAGGTLADTLTASQKSADGSCVEVPVKNAFAATEVEPSQFAEGTIAIE